MKKYFNLKVVALVLAMSTGAASMALAASDELNMLYKMAGLKMLDGKWINECDTEVQPKTKVIDLNGDGQPEVFILINDGMCYGNTGAFLSLFIKDKQGNWKSNLDFLAGGYNLLKTKNKGYPDIGIDVPGLCVPIWRWNGTSYAFHKSQCNR